MKALEYFEDHQSTTGLQLTHDQGTEWGKHFNLLKKKKRKRKAYKQCYGNGLLTPDKQTKVSPKCFITLKCFILLNLSHLGLRVL